ncbi:MAG: molybdenum cofactor biosysynthesis protein [Verrucomicrobiota bacterium]|nr:molybdenum cofactor biosysynthesis protein [Verrucomicrobiota bacterium]
MKILHLYLATGHNYFGRHGRGAADHPVTEAQTVRCLAGRGLEGDRFLDYKPDYRGQITFFAQEVYDELCDSLGRHDRSPEVLRRNVITCGVDLNSLIGQPFDLQGVQFQGIEECRPCYWMDQAFKPGAEKWLRGRGGLRARILTDGALRVDP